MGTVTIRVDDATRNELEALASTNGTSISTLLRDQIDIVLGRGVRMDRLDVPVSLSMQQRLLLAQNHEILALLHKDDEWQVAHHRRMVTVLQEGYTGEYGDLFTPIDAELTRADCELLWNVLDMFRVAGASIDNLSPDDRDALGEDDIKGLRFGGFDMNDRLESGMLTYLRFLISTDRWEELGPRLKEIGDNGNSHSRRLPVYKRMLNAFQPIWKGVISDASGIRLHLTADELRTVAEARFYRGS